MAAPLGAGSMPAVEGRGKSRKFEMMKQLKATEAGLQDRLRDESKASTWFDVSAPQTRQRRLTLRKNFEDFLQITYELTDLNDMYNPATFTNYCKEFLSVMVAISQGRIEDKIRTDVLWQHKEALNYYAVRVIDNFGAMFPNWHTQLVSHIHYLAKKHVLGKTHLHKSHLGSPELQLAWRWLLKQQSGVENMKQHYAAWLLAYVTAIRPGSITVSAGYAKGDSLGAAGLSRNADETLIWKDIDFVQLDGIEGIAAKVTFRCLKGHMNPYSKRMVVGQKVFTFLPTRGTMHELDVSAVLLGLAFSRGLFKFKTVEELFNCDLVFIPKIASVDAQAVFVNSSQSGELDVTKSMKEGRLNPVLQRMCTEIGLLERNTMYSFRRVAITEIQRSEGTELARQFANHTPDSNTVMSYDVTGLSDLDITALRLGDSEAIPRQQIRAAFAQSKLAKVDETVDLKAELDARVERAVLSDPQYIAMEDRYSTLLGEFADFLNIAPITVNNKVVPTYRKLLEANGSNEAYDAIDKLDVLLADRKRLRQTLRKQHFAKAKLAMVNEHKETLKTVRKKAVLPGGRGLQPQAIMDVLASGSAALPTEGAEDAELSRIEAMGVDDDDFQPDPEDEEVDENAVTTAQDEDEESARDIPTFWNKLGDQVTIMPEYSEEGGGTLAQAIAFVKTFAGLSSVSNTNLKCTLCGLDPTVPQSEKDRRWTLSKLKKHLKTSAYHGRTQQITRAAINTQLDEIVCPTCGKEFSPKTLAKHVEAEHEEAYIY